MNRRFLTGLGAAAMSAVALLSMSACTSSSGSAGPAPTSAAAAVAASSEAPSTATSSSQAVVTSTTSSAPVTVSSLTDPPSSSATSSPTSSSPTGTTPTKVVPPRPKPVAPKVSGQPAFGATNLSPRAALSVSAGAGVFQSIVVRNAEGEAVKGALSADRKTWTLGEPLGYDATYTVSGKAIGTGVNAGTATAVKGSYSTVSPDDTIRASLSPDDGQVVGIGAPILLSLGTDITDPVGRANIEKALTVTTVPRTEGSWAWIQHDDGIGLDWRPRAYWKPGTKVTVTANLYGVDFGSNLWGREDITTSFTIGRAQIVKGDVSTHRLIVYRDGKVLFNFPTSYGLESDPGRVTHSGTYIVMSKEYLHLMSNPAYHYKDFPAYYAVRISNNGTFIHQNNDTNDVQGYENVTHGCANLSGENAKAYYDTAMYGDPVEIVGSSIKLGAADGDNHDWSIPWSEWKTLSALSAT